MQIFYSFLRTCTGTTGEQPTPPQPRALEWENTGLRMAERLRCTWDYFSPPSVVPDVAADSQSDIYARGHELLLGPPLQA